MKQRIASIECFRVFAIFTVILNHTNFVSNISKLADGSFPVVLSGYLVAEVGVPFFLITAGYLFRQSLVAGRNPIAQFRRYVSPLAWLFFGWMCVYLITPPSWPAEVLHHGWWQPFYAEAQKNIPLLLTQNITLLLLGQRPVWHLWFLPALMFGLATLTLITLWRLETYLVPMILSLYVIIFSEEMAGGHLFNFPLHLGLWFTATLYTAIGWWLAGRESLSMTMVCSLLIGGYAIALLEGAVMANIFHSVSQVIHEHHFVGEIALSTGIVALAFAKPTLGQCTPIPLLAQFTLGVYLCHIFVLYTIQGPLNFVLGNKIPLRSVFVAIIVYIISVVVTMALARIPLLKYLVVKTAIRHEHIPSGLSLTERGHRTPNSL